MTPGFYCDNQRHLVCVPYSRAGLHRMALELSIKRCWFHKGASYEHYDIPKQDVARVRTHPRVRVVSPRVILAIAKGGSEDGGGVGDISPRRGD